MNKFGKIELIELSALHVYGLSPCPFVGAKVAIAGEHFEVHLMNHGEMKVFDTLINFLPDGLGEDVIIDAEYDNDAQAFSADRTELMAYLKRELATPVAAHDDSTSTDYEDDDLRAYLAECAAHFA